MIHGDYKVAKKGLGNVADMAIVLCDDIDVSAFDQKVSVFDHLLQSWEFSL